MYLTKEVKEILANYEGETPSVKSNLARLLMTGKLSGTGKMVILPVDQGFEHGPDKSFSENLPSYDPEYHIKLAVAAGLNAYAAPKGMLEAISDEFRGTIPLILKANCSNSLISSKLQPNQAIIGNIKDALYLGCTGIGFTIYPGSDYSLHMIQEVSELISEAKSYGLIIIIWSYPRGGDLSGDDETAMDVISYAIHIAASIGGNIIKVKLPSNIFKTESMSQMLSNNSKSYKFLGNRIKHVMHSAFARKRLVLFSGGHTKNEELIYKEIMAIKIGGGNGSIIGRNAFQRPYQKALNLFSNVTNIYLDPN